MPRPSMPVLARQLLMYSRANPGASDSAQGIARWWLDPHGSIDLQALDEALDFLVARGAFGERLAADGRRRYRRVCSDAQLQALLAELPAGADRENGAAIGGGRP